MSLESFKQPKKVYTLKGDVSVIILLRESTNNLQKNKELLLFARNRIGT
jgi:hypothetical protein